MQNVVIDPLVAFSILDDYLRRYAERASKKDDEAAPEAEGFVERKKVKKVLDNFSGGVVLGSQVKNTFYIRSVCPSMDSDTYLAVQKLAPTEKFLGWYTTDMANINVIEVTTELKAPTSSVIISVVAPTAENTTVRFRAFMMQNITLKEKEGQKQALQELECSVESTDAQTSVVLDTMGSTLFPSLARDSDPSRAPTTTPVSDVFAELRAIKANLQIAQQYVDDVIAGRREGDKTVGRGLSEILVTNKVSTASPKVMEEKLQDVMMLQYLAKIAAQQVEALSSSALLIAPKKAKVQMGHGDALGVE